MTGQQWYAGGSSKGFVTPSDAVLVALYDGLINIPILSNVPDIIAKNEPTIYIKWQDQAKAPLKKIEDWQGFLRGLRGTSLPIAVGCMGGHGRTGTFLSIMAWLMGLPQKEQKKPVQYIRDIYCKECVESKVQFEQIKDMTGVDETSLYVSYSTYDYAGAGYYWTKGSTGYGVYKPKDNDEKPFAVNHNPDDDNIKYGYFWCKRHHGSFEKLMGSPANCGGWQQDTSGWYWQWDKGEKEEYYPLETMGEVDVDTELDDFDEFVDAQSLGGKGDYLGDYQPNGSDNGDSLI